MRFPKAAGIKKKKEQKVCVCVENFDGHVGGPKELFAENSRRSGGGLYRVSGNNRVASRVG